MKPRVDQTDFSDPDECSALRKNLSHIGLVGYSYGTSLIQQLSEIAAHGITSRAKAQGLDNPGLRAASALSAVKAVNIGPVAKFKHIDAEGHINMLEADDPHHADALTLFSQVSVLMSDDKIVQRSYGHELLGGVMSSEIGIEVRDTVTTSTYTDYVGLPNHAGIGTFVLPDGQRFPKIITAFDYMIHDLRSYMNVQEVQGNIAIYPSFAVAPILRASTAQMFNATQTGDQWLASLRNQFSSASSRHDLVTFFREQRTEFNALVMAFREAVYQDAIPMLANHVNGLRARLAGINSDALPNPAPQRQIS
jgi:hypothetical protein